MASIAVAALVPFMEGRAMSSAVRRVETMVWRARGYAASHRTKTLLHLRPGDNAMAVYPIMENQNGNYYLPYESIRDEKMLPENISFVDDTANPQVPALPRTRPILRENKGGGFDPLVEDQSGNAMDVPGMVFLPNGSLDPSWMTQGIVSPEIVLRDEQDRQRVVKVIFATGLTRTYDR